MKKTIAYFCAEYGIDYRLPLYAGGLGVLAGDTLKQAADDGVNLVALGLLYRGDQMVQQISPEGWQTEADFGYDPLSNGIEHVYVDDKPLFVKVHLGDHDVWLRCWKKTISDTVTLYLLDAETDQNLISDRILTRQLYFGNDTYQFQQQLLLGIGGIKLLEALSIRPDIYHINEGRPALMHWQMIHNLMETHGLDYQDGRKLAISQTVYTNHTLVSAGNKQYPLDLLAQYGEYYAQQMNISVDTLVAPGLTENKTFSVSDYALNAARKANGVSQLHTKLSEDQWPGHNWVNITNGIHMPTWQAHEMAAAATDEQLWNNHLEQKRKTEQFIKELTGFGYNPDQLVIGWARRLAGYKRLEAIFADIERLKSLLMATDRPVQLLISGKVHQGNQPGKEMLKTAINYMQTELAGQVLYIPDYNLQIASYMTRGVDVWLNTPEHGKEACGTSGMKAIANGVLQCTVADGWAAEVNVSEIGWELNSDNISNSFYDTLEKEIAPQFYESNKPGQEWLDKMKNAVTLADQFSAKRMLNEYLTKLYE